jgi:hypothetical protein
VAAMRQLRAYGIYKLPCIRPVFAMPAAAGFLLFDAALGQDLPHRFEVEASGRLKNWHGDELLLTVEQLEDTGETYRPGGAKEED